MLRRKNPDLTYVQPNPSHSPYRFERKNPQLSPGLSPMRCRTPTRTNISPFRTNHNDNFRGHSPIKFVSSKVPNPVNQIAKGFFRTQTHTNYQTQFNQKYTTSNFNNDHSAKRQSFYENPNSSKINPPYENSERTMLHENTKLFSKLVQKINSEKKKQPEMVRRNTKPQIYKPQQISQVEQKHSGIEKLTKQKSQTDHSKIEPINQHIKPVESVVYEQRQARTYTYQHQTNNYVVYGKENKDHEHQGAYKVKTQIEKPVPLQTAKNNNLKVQKAEEKTQNQQKIHRQMTTPSKNQEVQKDKAKKQGQRYQKQGQRNQGGNNANNQYYPNTNKANEGQKKAPNYDDPDNFEDIEMLLKKINPMPKYEATQIKYSLSNISQASNVNGSILNMDPFL